MSKEESIYIGKPMSDEEFEAYMERMDDSENCSRDRWNYLIESWTCELFRVHDDTLI